MLSIEDSPLWLLIIDITLVTATLLHMLYQRRSPQSLSTWLLTIILLPYIGVLLYLFFGLRKSHNKRYKDIITQQPVTQIKEASGTKYELDTLMNANQISGTTENNHIKLIYSDIEAFETLIKLIEKAEKEISLETYIFEADKTGKAILNALTESAQRGVQVRLLMDAIGSFSLYLNQKPLKELREAGGKAAFFQPIWPNIITNQINLRNHRKIYIFDQKTLLTGGLNLSNDYLGVDTKETRWLDLLFKIKGPTCFHYQNIFNEDWFFSTKEKLGLNEIAHTSQKGETVQAIPSGPDIESDTLYEALLLCIHSAKKTIKIATPYFIPNNNVMNALLIAIKRGVRVTILTPTKSDHWLFDFGRSSYMREFSEAGGKLFYYPHNMLHAKLFIFDGEVALSGSANLDYRSLFLNYEMVHFLYCENTIEKLLEWYEENLKQGQIYQAKDTKSARFIENISRIIAPIL